MEYPAKDPWKSGYSQIPLIAGRPREFSRSELVSDLALHYHLRGLDVTHQGPSLIFYVAGRDMKSDRPIDLALTKFQFHFPVTAVASILHRLTGMVYTASRDHPMVCVRLVLEGG